MAHANSAREQVEELLKVLYFSNNIEEESGPLTALSNAVRRGSSEIVLENVKEQLKRGPAAVKGKCMTILDQLTLGCGPQFAVLLSSEKWMDRFVKAAKSAGDEGVVCKIIGTIASWYKRYHTEGFRAGLQRFGQSRSLGDAFKKVQGQMNLGERVTEGPPKKGILENLAMSFQGQNKNTALNQMEALLLEIQGDISSLEYTLQHPHVLHDDAIANECKVHKLRCMQLLESGQEEKIEMQLMEFIERISQALEIYEAVTGLDLGEGEAARSRALANSDEKGQSDSDDERRQRLRARAAPQQSAEQLMLQAQEATQQLVEQERAESMKLRTELEGLRCKYEELQNKFKDAKAKNKEAVAALEEYATRLEQLETEGQEKAVAAEKKSSHKDPMMFPNVNVLDVANRMQEALQGIRHSLREVREQYVQDIRRESSYYSSQLTGAVAAIVAAAERERGSDNQALLLTQELYKKEMKLRKQYYNTIQELKGNIRVYCRVRPLLPREISAGHTSIMEFPSSDEIKLVDQNGRPKSYEFDEVYPPDAPQSKVFEDTSPLIDSVVDGYNVCIFAYGQTGSGKTHTMGGADGDAKGINTRALERLFQIIEERKDTEESTVGVSVLEIYCEVIYDLMVSKDKAKNISYEVKQGGPQGTYVTNLSEVPVQSPEDINAIMERANKNRSEGRTNMNEHSSRSHMIVYITVRTTNKQTKAQCFGKLSLVDLAGSERLDKTGAQGQQLKEAVAINKSLSSLGDVIAGLAQSSKHVPFRNSILTYLLQDSMGGQAKVLMFVCVNPASYNACESNSSLQFASRARGVSFGQAKKNTVT
ncbi:Microtubule binding Kinesin motor domain [Trypanosoma vivax]|nr:C-terminal motor kinesin [Trypanosoma vivax]KAH8611578.1 Microtubule binding Kinesin motor domain [Trypanosoma vivax]KAH8620811.1 Microtubule binding Kinesin motor domain [Trypanosoma vivax]